MPKISVVPTQEVIKMSHDQGMLPERYIGGVEKTLIPYDLRYKDEKGKFLHDLKITRDDGSSFSIHEVESECDDLPKFVISDYTKNGTKRFYAYTHELDLVRLQNDKNYLYAFSEVLCSKDRIAEKKQVSLKNNNNEYIYLGGLRYDNEAKKYVKIAKRYKEIEEEIESKRKKSPYLKFKTEEKNINDKEIGNITEHFKKRKNLNQLDIANSSIPINNKTKEQKEKSMLIGDITEYLIGLNQEELKKIAKKLGIN